MNLCVDGLDIAGEVLGVAFANMIYVDKLVLVCNCGQEIRQFFRQFSSERNLEIRAGMAECELGRMKKDTLEL